jgi:hypothetical protein
MIRILESSLSEEAEYLKIPWPLVRERTIPTGRQPLVADVSANFSG